MNIRDKIYVGALASVCEKMEDLIEEKNLNLKKAIKLNQKYCLLADKTYGDESRSSSDRDSWCLAFSHAYEPSHMALSLKLYSELQGSQTLENKTEGGKK